MTDHDMTRIPKWAQAAILELERKVEQRDSTIRSLRAQLSAGPEDSRVFADPYSDSPRPLGSDPLVRFGGPEFERTFDVQLSGGGIQVLVNDDGGVPVIMPQSRNTFTIAIIPRQGGR